MQWLLTFILQSYCLFVAVNASPLGHSLTEDINTSNFTRLLFPRVRVGGGSGSGGDPKTTTELFLLDDFPGNCNGQTGTIDGWLEEIYLLHDAVVKAYAYDSVALAYLWYVFFGVPPGNSNRPLWIAIGEHISRVSKFLAGGGLTNPAKDGENPRLFCSADAGTYQEWGQPTKDKNGEPVIFEEDPLEYLLLGDTFPSESQTENGRAFWFESFNGYGFDHKGREVLCSDMPDNKGRVRYATTGKPFSLFPPKTYGLTVAFGAANRHILLCPRTFSPFAGTHSYPSLLQAVSADNYPVAGQEDPDKALDRLLPISATLYHELYHLTDNNNTPDKFYSLQDIVDGAQDFPMQAAHNPETYAMFATAAYVLQNPPDGVEAALYLSSFPVKASDPFGNRG
ncbi:hypothetical protein F5Y10DRAFT_234098 [Nemania abortiva]|nr:hypothetical protein F5Y10DRAFT_234098 [Nemania abortiva]